MYLTSVTDLCMQFIALNIVVVDRARNRNGFNPHYLINFETENAITAVEYYKMIVFERYQLLRKLRFIELSRVG